MTAAASISAEDREVFYFFIFISRVRHMRESLCGWIMTPVSRLHLLVLLIHFSNVSVTPFCNEGEVLEVVLLQKSTECHCGVNLQHQFLGSDI